MNVKRFLFASIIVFIVFEALNYLIHGLILAGAYEATMDLWRADMNQTMWIIYLGDLVRAFLFVFIFIKGYENKGWAEGLRYGFWIGLYVSIGMAFGEYAMYPIPLMMAVQWFVYGVIQLIICGIVTALIYKSAKKAKK